MAAPLRNRMFLKRIVEKGFLFRADESHVPLRWIPHRCQNLRQYSHLHRPHRLRQTATKTSRYKKLYNITVIRHASSGNQSDIPDGYIPDIPDVPVAEVVDTIPVLAELNAIGEPTLQSLGLASYYPSGLVQQGLEMIHVGLDIPWWSSIMIVVVIVRTCMFPLIIRQRRTIVKYSNIQPELLKIQEELQEAQATTDYMEAEKAANKMKSVAKKHGIAVRDMVIPVLIQIPVFMSVFFGLRRLAEYPVLSMQTGGCLWFPDLTVADPIVMLPVITAASMWINLEIGAESMKTNSATNAQITKIFMRCMPLVTLLVTMQFPAALSVYWASSNIFTLLQASLLRIPKVRSALGIPVEIQHEPPAQPPRKTRIVKRFKDAYRTTSKLTEATDRKQVNDMSFRRTSDELLQEGWREMDQVARPTRSITENIEENKTEEKVKEIQKL